MTKTYSISVLPQNYHTGNHSIAAGDFRLRTKQDISFKMQNGLELTVSYIDINNYINKNKKKCTRWITKDKVDKKTNEIKHVNIPIFLISNEFIYSHHI